MTSTTCEVKVPLPIQVNLAFGQLISLVTVGSTLLAVRTLIIRSIYHNSTRILLIVCLGFANMHEVTKAFSQAAGYIRVINIPCDYQVTSLSCQLENTLIVCSIAGMVITQCAMSIERFSATFWPQMFANNSSLPGVLLGSISILSSAFVPFVTFYGDPLTDVVANCVFMPKQSASRANTLLMSYTIVAVANVFANSLILLVNKRREKVHFDLTARYGKHELLVTTRAVCWISMAQFVALALYSTSTLLLRSMRDDIPVMLYTTLITWAYAVPYAAASLPLLILLSAWCIGRKRRSVINVITTQRETQEQHMKKLTDFWDQRLITKNKT